MTTRAEAQYGQRVSPGGVGGAIPATASAASPGRVMRSDVQGMSNVASTSTGRSNVASRSSDGGSDQLKSRAADVSREQRDPGSSARP